MPENQLNQPSVVITTLLHYNVEVRDTLEYCLNKPSYDVALFKNKKRSVIVEVDQNTPLKNILNNSKENEAGAKLEKLIRDFYAEVYDGNILTLGVDPDGKEEVRVDHSQTLVIYKYVLPIHQNVSAMIAGILNDAHSKNIDVAEVEKVYRAEEKMFSAVAYLTLVGDLNRLFAEYNKARQEAQGAITPVSNFIQQDLEQVIRYINTVRAGSRVTALVFKTMEDKINALVETMTGRRDLPEGKNHNDLMRETAETVNLYVRDVEAEFRVVYPPLVQKLVEQANANNTASGDNQAA